MREFYAVAVYEKFAGAFRVRALYTPSEYPASADRDSYYGCPAIPEEDPTRGDKLAGGGWWAATDEKGVAFREAFWASVDTFSDANRRRYPNDLDVGSSNQAITNELLRDLYRNITVCLIVRSLRDEHVSGFTSSVYRPAPHAGRHVRVGFGGKEIHELGHAFGLLSDEYINGRGTPETSTRKDPATPSVFSLSNLRYSDRLEGLPWAHLSPCGWHRRTASGQKPSPLVGWLWVGGSVHRGVWHSEYRCLMNGRHDNFQFTQDAPNDPTANDDGSYTGASLRDIDRFCSWCQEIVTLRILEKTDQLLDDGDSSDATRRGIVWYNRWIDSLRSNYFELFDVPSQIDAAEANYAALAPGKNGEPLWQSDLCVIPTSSSSPPVSPVPPLAADELSLLTALAAGS